MMEGWLLKFGRTGQIDPPAGPETGFSSRD